MDNTQPRLVNLNYFSLNFPQDLESEILRENVISTIEKLFESDINLVILNGEEGIGKTSILKQFAQKNKDKVISSFLNPFKEIYSSNDLLLNDLFYQLHWLINGKEFTEYPQVDLDKYRDMFFTLIRDRKRRNLDLIFLIDGLEHIQDERSIKNILGILPIGESGFKTILSGKEDTIKRCLGKLPNVISTNFHLPSFSTEETKKYFDDLNININAIEVKQLWQAANRGVPGRLQSIKRALKGRDITIDKFLDELEQLEDIHELDWVHLIQLKDSISEEITKFISLDESLYSVDKISRVLNVDIQKIRSSLSKLSFIYINNKDEIVFNSIGSKRFFSKKYAASKHQVHKQNINYYLNRKDEAESLIQLPKYYSQEKDYDSLIQLLSEDYFPKVIKSSQSISVVQSLISTGYNAAKKTENDLKLLNFSLHGSLIENIEGLHIWDSELEARIELGDYDNAVSLANSALLKEDRLRFLSKIAKVKRRKGDIIEEALIEQIKQLYSIVDLVNLGDKAVDIASDLFYSMPNLALDLIKHSSGKNETNINDWVLAKLTLNAIEAKDNVDPQNVTSLIHDPKIREIGNSLTYLFGKYTSDDILKEAKKLSDARDRIMFLRIWISGNSQDNGLKDVLSYLISQLVEFSSKEFSRVSLLRDISTPLSNIKDHDATEKMIVVLLTFKEEAKKFGSNLEYFQFILNLFEAKINYNYNEALGLFFELHKNVNDVPDLVTKLECIALLSKHLSSLKVPLIKSHHYLKDTLKSTVKNLISEICNKTAYHYHNLKDAIEIVASYDPIFAIEVSLNANTIYRRDGLLLRCWIGYIADKSKHYELGVLKSIHSKIESKDFKNEAIRILIQNNSERDTQFEKPLVDFIKSEVYLIPSLQSKSYCLVHLIRLLSKNTTNGSIISELKK
ncbi:MAG TPA: hypothetical protein DHV26_02430, partial [Cytophagales bacterium]|nr:hypothetical protein [Cytophagales bacterium]